MIKKVKYLCYINYNEGLNGTKANEGNMKSGNVQEKRFRDGWGV